MKKFVGRGVFYFLPQKGKIKAMKGEERRKKEKRSEGSRKRKCEKF